MSTSPATEHDPHRIGSRYEMLRLLRRMLDDGLLIQMQGPHPQISVVTTMLDIDLDAEHLIVDCASHDAINQQFLDAGTADFETSIDHVKVQFSTDQITSTYFEGKPALCLALPEFMRRIQRREFFRVPVPVTNPATCALMLTQPPVVFDLYDISVGGVALLDKNRRINFRVGMMLHDCTLHLPDIGTITATLQVTRERELLLPSGTPIRHIGAAFVNLQGAAENLVQTYTTRLERQLIAKERGLQ